MTIEQEFFEAFNYKPKYRYDVELTDIYSIQPFVAKNSTKEEVISWHNDSQYLTLKVLKIAKLYPPITPEIALKLIKILLKSSNEFHIDISKGEYGCDQGFIGGFYQQTFEQSILSLCIEAKDEIQDQVQQIEWEN